MFRDILFRLGSDPHKSWSIFQKGLFVFVLGVCFTLAGAKWWIWLQIPGVVLLAVGLLIAAKGYLGIFANRFSQTLNQLAANAAKDKRNSRPK
jgi:thiol:disulfide interchange protein